MPLALQRYALVALGGALGSILRYFLSTAVAHKLTIRFPAGTLIVNIIACFLIGLSIEYLVRHAGLSEAWRYLVPIGFIGGFSTFSTFEYELFTSFTTGALWEGALYLAASVVLGLFAVAAGAATARSLA